jgi:chemotaxis signal transduction protein
VRDVRDLARLFDEAFADPEPAGAGGRSTFICLEAGGSPYAVPLPDVAALAAAGRIVPVPSDAPALLGLGVVGDRVVPVFDLAALLGGQASLEPARWLLLPAGADPIALAFSRLEGQSRLPEAEVPPPPDAAPGAGRAVRIGERWRPILDLGRLRAAARPAVVDKEA